MQPEPRPASCLLEHIFYRVQRWQAHVRGTLSAGEQTELVAHLDGWTLKAGHNMVNGMTWGPDGWLYGRHGITAPSLVGRPGAPALDLERRRFHSPCGAPRIVTM